METATKQSPAATTTTTTTQKLTIPATAVVAIPVQLWHGKVVQSLCKTIKGNRLQPYTIPTTKGGASTTAAILCSSPPAAAATAASDNKSCSNCNNAIANRQSIATLKTDSNSERQSNIKVTNMYNSNTMLILPMMPTTKALSTHHHHQHQQQQQQHQQQQQQHHTYYTPAQFTAASAGVYHARKAEADPNRVSNILFNEFSFGKNEKR